MNPFLIKSLPLLILAIFSATNACAQQQSDDAFPMSRDAAIGDLVATYSEENCSSRFLDKFGMALSECTAKVALAKKDCPATISEGLPDELDEKQTYKLVARSKACVLTTIWGRPYNVEAADRASEKVWKKDHPD